MIIRVLVRFMRIITELRHHYIIALWAQISFGDLILCNSIKLSPNDYLHRVSSCFELQKVLANAKITIRIFPIRVSTNKIFKKKYLTKIDSFLSRFLLTELLDVMYYKLIVKLNLKFLAALNEYSR